MTAVSWAPFARELRSVREAKGYASARSFYLSGGGRKFFGATYRQYLNVENGLSGPGPLLVEKIALALQISTDPERAPGFFRSYLLCVVASPSLLDVILQNLASAPPTSGAELAPMQKALARQSESRAEMLSREQADAIDSSLATFWLWNLLINDSARWTPDALAAATRLEKSEVRAALKSLHASGLIARDAEGRFYCDRLRRVFRFPRDGHYALGRDRHRKYVEEIAASGGKDLFRHYTLFRGSAKEVLDYAPNLRAAVEGANICETTEKGSDTGLTVVEIVARQLFHY
jgi:hypothetical protein